MDVEVSEKEGDKKRSRKKQLYQDIVKQVEFYLSPANLAKDRFMSQALQDNPDGIELSVLLRCNKLRSLTTDIAVLKKALKLSTTLELTDNQLRVRSKIPYQPKQNVDECTIYVERLPLDATIDYMHQVFSQYGSVDYVSLPKFPNGKIKGFGFVEFSDPEAADKTIQEFKKSGCYLSIDMDPFNLRSVCTLDKKTKESLLKGKNNKTDFDEFANHSREEEDMNVVTNEIQQVGIETRNGGVEGEDSDNEKKRKHKTSPSTLERKKKKVRKEDDKLSENEPKASLPDDTKSEVDKVPVKSEVDRDEMEKDIVEQKTDHSSGENDEEGDENKNKKKRRQKKKPKKSPGHHVGMMILSKGDWKRLRNMYLNSQRAKMRLIKKHLYKCRQQSNIDNLEENSQDAYDDDNMNSVEVPGSVVKIELDHPVIDVKSFKNEIRKESEDIVNIDVKEGVSQVYVRFRSSEATQSFGKTTQHNYTIIEDQEELDYWIKIHQDRENKKDKRNKKEGKENTTTIVIDDSNEKPVSKGLLEKPRLSIETGTIVKLETTQPIVDVKNFKSGIKKSNSSVIYIDIKEGSNEAYIRLDKPESAKLFSGPNNPFGSAKLLTGSEEQSYMDKINEDRANKFNKSVRIKKRGKCKVISNAEKLMGKHIILDTDDLDPSCMECVEME